MYITVRVHFTQRKSRLLEEGRRIRFSEEKFRESASRVTIFDMISRKYTERQFFVMCVANCMYGYYDFAYDPPTAVRNYNLFYKRRQMMNELVKEDFRTLFIVRRLKPEDFTAMIRLYLAGQIAFETLVLINKFVRFTEQLSQHFSEKSSIIGVGGLIEKSLLLRIERAEKFVKLTDEVKTLIFQRYNLIKDN